MKKIIVFISFICLLITGNAQNKWWSWFGDWRLGLSAGANIPLGDMEFKFADAGNTGFTTLSTENFKYATIGPNVGIYFGFEKLLSDHFSFGAGNHVGYQREQFTVDMKGKKFDAIGTVNINSLYDYLDIYFSYFPTQKFSLNLGVGLYYDWALSQSVSTQQVEGKSKDDKFKFEDRFIQSSNMGLQAMVGATYHVTNNWFVTLSARYHAYSLYESTVDTQKRYEDSKDVLSVKASGSNPGSGSGGIGGGGGLNPGGSGGIGGGGAGGSINSMTLDDMLKLLNMNYMSDGVWYQSTSYGRASVLITIGYRW